MGLFSGRARDKSMAVPYDREIIYSNGVRLRKRVSQPMVEILDDKKYSSVGPFCNNISYGNQ